MSHVLRETRIVDRGNRYDDSVMVSGVSVLARMVYVISGIITGLLALRFILVFFGANPSNPFANFIFTTSNPLVAPFAGLFNVQTSYGTSRIEIESIIAIIVYSIVAWLVVKLIAALTNTPEA